MVRTPKPCERCSEQPKVGLISDNIEVLQRMIGYLREDM